MTSTPPRSSKADAPLTVILRGALLPAGVVGVIVVLVAWVWRGSAGAGSALIAVVLALLFFSSGLVLLHRFVTESNPMLFMAVGVAVYLAQILVLLGCMLLLNGVSWLDTKVFAVALLVVLIAWQAFQFRAWQGARVPIYDEPGVRETGDET